MLFKRDFLCFRIHFYKNVKRRHSQVVRQKIANLLLPSSNLGVAYLKHTIHTCEYMWAFLLLSLCEKTFDKGILLSWSDKNSSWGRGYPPRILISIRFCNEWRGPFQGLTNNSLQNTKKFYSYDLLIDRFL